MSFKYLQSHYVYPTFFIKWLPPNTTTWGTYSVNTEFSHDKNFLGLNPEKPIKTVSRDSATPFCKVWRPFTLSKWELQVREHEHVKVTREPPKAQTPCFGGNHSLRTLMGDQDPQMPAAICVFTHLLLKTSLFLRSQWMLGGTAPLSDPI